jgi:ATP-dependent protease HslVU (ClpYQ) peptidase subunit
MTCIVGLRDSGQVWIGGDSASVTDHTIGVRADGKVFWTGSYLIGFSTSFRMGQLLQHKLVLPEPPPEGLAAFMVTDFAEAVRECFRSGGFARSDAGSEIGGHFLVGVRDRLFHLCGDYQVAEYDSGFAATGSGEDFALGSLHSTTGQPPLHRVLSALEAAERFAWAVRRPFHIGATGLAGIQVYGAFEAPAAPVKAAAGVDGHADNGALRLLAEGLGRVHR